MVKKREPFPEIPDLYQMVYELITYIPKGRVSTYGAVAEALGDKTAARAVGKILSENSNPELYPCYKIVYSDGAVGNYRLGGVTEKSRLLSADGIKISDGGIIDLKRYFFGNFVSDKPLARLHEYQDRFMPEIESIGSAIRTVGGVDVSYSGNSKNAVAVYTLFDFKMNKMLDYTIQSDKICFPYIPSYLSFRELPILSKLIEKAELGKKSADVVLVDGNGLIHPRNSGVASMLGAVCGIKTIGVAKSLLCGTAGDDNFIRMNNKVIGKRITKGFKPVFVSAGWKTDLSEAASIVSEMMIRRLPEPLRMAHILSKSLMAN